VIMAAVDRDRLPEGVLLSKYRHGDAYTDCYVASLARDVSHAEYVEAFYTTWLFKLERVLLSWFVSKPSTDAQAAQLAAGSLDSFAAWVVEARCANELLMSDFRGHTRSWLMVAHVEERGGKDTRLYFGSAVVPAVRASSGARTMGFRFYLLLGFHKLYSRALLLAARSRLARKRSSGT
jgi:hypothetical protein